MMPLLLFLLSFGVQILLSKRGMEGYLGKDEKCLQLLDLIRSKTDCVEKREGKGYGVSEEEELELRLGPPGGDISVVSFGSSSVAAERRFLECINGGRAKEFSLFQSVQPGCIQKRSAPCSVVGWPPIRSLRKNRASSSSFLKPQNLVESSQKGLFVKINMDGVPIGRKVDLKACDTYKKLSSAVDQLFTGLLAAQNGTENGYKEGGKVFASLLDGRGEYALVFEDNEGDRKLVKDVQWHVFVSTVKRLRVSKTSELSTPKSKP
ncbi:PREDICTED: auxin-responsive protein IAA26-like [Ipomoea nil]|uniref:auxin-responsive protein IAA26-like n=1 Tax=Ipomoea nil TaxID=35883 RepID=UPI000901E856|nr:PREDICTED: auxin-responsive protein IAA26-like [Ipomoea nil]